MEKDSKKLFNGTSKARSRRERVIKRLNLQLKSKEKTVFQKLTGSSKVVLEEQDVKRIEKELEVLKQRI